MIRGLCLLMVRDGFHKADIVRRQKTDADYRYHEVKKASFPGLRAIIILVFSQELGESLVL